jgi:hypothetical protein
MFSILYLIPIIYYKYIHMTHRFDEGVKEIVMTLLSLGATMYETDYVLKQINKRPEPIEQKIEALKIADDRIDNIQFDQTVKSVISKLEQEVEPQKPKEPAKKFGLDKEQLAYYKLTEEGKLTPIAAIGIIANLQAESKLEPTTKQIAAYTKGGGVKYGPGRGIAQWEIGGRFDTDRINLKAFANKRGTDWTDYDTQIAFIIHELDTHPEFKRVKQELNKAKTVKDAVIIFLKKYEKAGIPHLTNRLKYGEDLMSKYSARVNN